VSQALALADFSSSKALTSASGFAAVAELVRTGTPCFSLQKKLDTKKEMK
jgi:hypothetical protein